MVRPVSSPTKLLGFMESPTAGNRLTVGGLPGWTVGLRRVAGRVQNPTGGVQRQAPGLLPGPSENFP